MSVSKKVILTARLMLAEIKNCNNNLIVLPSIIKKEDGFGYGDYSQKALIKACNRLKEAAFSHQKNTAQYAVSKADNEFIKELSPLVGDWYERCGKLSTETCPALARIKLVEIDKSLLKIENLINFN